MKQIFGLILLLMSLQAQAQEQKYKTIEEYIQAHKGLAIKEMERSGIPASIKLAQAIQESGFGNSELAMKTNNHFGIKCGNDWKGEQYINEKHANSCYRIYTDSRQGYVDHTELLKTRKHYAFLFQYSNTDYKSWAKGLLKAGYASDPKYPERLITSIEKHKLNRFDTMGVQFIVFEEGGDGIATDNNDSTVLRYESKRKTRRAKERSFLFESYKAGVFRTNDASYMYAKSGESALAAATRMGVPYQRFLKFNDLIDGDALIEFQPLYVQPKKSSYKGEIAFHKVEQGETIYELSQLYGLRMEALLSRNQLKEGEEVANGEMVMLREKAFSRPKIRPADYKEELPPARRDSSDKKTPLPNPTPAKADTNTVLRPKQSVELDKPSPPAPTPVKTDTARKTPAPPLPPAPPKVDSSRKTPPPPAPPLPPAPPKVDSSRKTPPPAPPLPPAPPKVDSSRKTPPPPTPPLPTPQKIGGKHTVKAGDTLSSIAKQYKTTVAHIKSLNKMRTDNIYVGQVLQIP